MNTDRIRYFALVVETKNLRKAAEMAGISPGSMSKAMTVLEGELKMKLLRPEGRGIEITPQGAKIYQQSLRLLDELKQFQKNIETPGASTAAKVTFGTFEVFSSYFVSQFIFTHLKDERIRLHEHVPGKIESAILERVVDYGLTYLPSPHPDLEFTEIGTFQMGIFGQKEKKWEKLDPKVWCFAVPITPISVHSIDTDSLDMWPKSNFTRYIKYEFELLETAIQTSRLGLSVIHCPDFIVKFHNQHCEEKMHLVPLPYPSGVKSPKKVKIYFIYRKGEKPFNGLEGKLAKFIRALK